MGWFGLGPLDAAGPRSINVVPIPLRVRPMFAKLPPTAKQRVALAHDTPERSVESAWSGFGLATSDQLVPSQRSTNVPGSVEPTA